MFNLEQSIAGWRKQMFAAGIQTPVPLDELEGHLREEIEQQVKSGSDELSAFQLAVQKVGAPRSLQTEFKKLDAGFWAILGANKTVRINRMLGLLWLIYCLGSFYKLTSGMWSAFPQPDFQFTPLFWLAVLMDLIYFRGLMASIRLATGVTRERRFILLLAVLDAIGGVAFLSYHPFQPLVGFYTLAGFISIWLLWPPRKAKLAVE